MPIQMRLSQSDPRLYSPDRDIAYCAPHIIKRAISGLDTDRQEPWVREHIKKNGITDDELVAAARAAASYINATLLDPALKDSYAALDAAGLFKLREPTMILLCAKLGQVFLSSIFPSMRDVTRDPNSPPFDAAGLAQAADDTVSKIKAQRPWWRAALDFFSVAKKQKA